MGHISRIAGVGLLVYGIGTTVGFVGAGGPGGDYDGAIVTAYWDSHHYPAAFAFWYLAALAALGLVVFGLGVRRIGGLVGEALWGLAIAGTAVSVVGAFVGGGLLVAGAEGGVTVQAGVPHPVVYTVSEIGNLLAVCAPALFVGVAAIVLALRAGLPTWLRVLNVPAGICGILAPFYFTLGFYLLWVLVFGTWAVLRGEHTTSVAPERLHESLV
jgi:hypothetical protein